MNITESGGRRRNRNEPPQFVAAVFDLDGVLIDSARGIGISLDNALRSTGFEPASEIELKRLIGPPLSEGVAALFEARGIRDDLVGPVVRAFRADYSTVSLRETSVFAGVVEMLRALRSAGWLMAIATSKPSPSAEALINALELAEFFDAVSCAPASGAETKVETLGRVLTQLPCAPANSLMVGDRGVDMRAAVAHGCYAIGANWGYGTSAELEAAGARTIIDDPGHLVQLANSLR